jgi:NFU1 iron-sulfur cluster scaffold homolog, mitochondrial
MNTVWFAHPSFHFASLRQDEGGSERKATQKQNGIPKLAMANRRQSFPLGALFAGSLLMIAAAFHPCSKISRQVAFTRRSNVWSTSRDETSSTETAAPAPVLNGKRVLPYKIVMAGLKGHKVAAVYAVLNSSFQRGSEGWESTSFVGVSQDLEATLRSLYENDATELKVAHIRALTFSYPQPNAMQDVAMQWRELATNAGAVLDDSWANDVLNYLFDAEDDDEDDEDDIEMMAQAMATVSASGQSIISPFDVSKTTDPVPSSSSDDADLSLTFNADNVDAVLNEVRPYLIADGGNVAVERVDEAEKTVYLKLEGACGSCASSTVTMKMGIERVLKEKFPDIREIVQIENAHESKELTLGVVQDEINRLKPAIIAMGGVVRLVGIDSVSGLVSMEFSGAQKVRQGLELAILDVPFVSEVRFVEENENA